MFLGESWLSLVSLRANEPYYRMVSTQTNELFDARVSLQPNELFDARVLFHVSQGTRLGITTFERVVKSDGNTALERVINLVGVIQKEWVKYGKGSFGNERFMG